jgi:hypothetical protein
MTTNAIPDTMMLLSLVCDGPNERCRQLARNGHTVHIIPKYTATADTLIMPSNHYESVEAGIKAIETAQATAITIKTDNELYAARKAGIPHKLPIGWIDPSRR